MRGSPDPSARAAPPPSAAGLPAPAPRRARPAHAARSPGTGAAPRAPSSPSLCRSTRFADRQTSSSVLAQPAFTPFVVLDVPVGLPGPNVGEPEIKLLDIRVLPERFCRAVEHDPPVLHHIAVVGDGQRERGVLLHQEHGELLLPVQPL